MKPITRKELYLNKIVGNNDYEIPEKPITTEEFFFAEILGEAVQAPEPLTRYQIYLAKIAGRNIEIPYPETRLEYFLARAAGMDITVPVPITREEIYWSNYTAIVEFEVEGVPPLTYKAVTGKLKDYRIYGQTSRNLFDFSTVTNGYRITWATGAQVADDSAIMSDYIPISKGIYRANASFHLIGYDANKNYIGAYNPNTKSFAKEYGSKTSWYEPTDSDIKFVRLMSYSSTDTIVENTMFYAGSTVIPYEPYGESVGDLVAEGEHAGEYKVPVTVEGKNLFDYNDLENGGISSTTGENIAYNHKRNASYIDVQPLTNYCISNLNGDIMVHFYSSNYEYLGNQLVSATFTSPQNCYYCRFAGAPENFNVNIMLNSGTTALPYEPYQTPITTPIYLPEPIKMVGSEVEYVDYVEQKQHFADGTSIDVFLPALPTLSGTNTLSVGTEVQPSKVYIKGQKEREYT